MPSCWRPQDAKIRMHCTLLNSLPWRVVCPFRVESIWPFAGGTVHRPEVSEATVEDQSKLRGLPLSAATASATARGWLASGLRAGSPRAGRGASASLPSPRRRRPATLGVQLPNPLRHPLVRNKSRQGGFCPVADPLGLVFGHRGKDMEREARGRWDVAGYELDATVHQGRGELDVAGEAVQAGHNQNRLRSLRVGDGLLHQLRAGSAILPVSISVKDATISPGSDAGR